MKLKKLRSFTSALLVVAFVSLGLMSCRETSSPQEKEATPLRNLVVILGDDHSYRVMGAYGNDKVKTPNLDRLAAEGIRFTNAYANSPICNASRQSMLTGKYPHATRVNLLFTPFPDQSNETIAENLRQQGFKTALIGKNHFNNWVWQPLYQDGTPDHGFDLLIDNAEYREYLKNNRKKPVDPGLKTYGKNGEKTTAYQKNAGMLPSPCYDEDCKGTYLAQEAVKFIENNKDQRFMLWVGFNEPHAPFNFPIDYAGLYDPEEMTIPAGSLEDDRWQPEIFKDLTEAEKMGIIASYYTSVSYMDKNAGLILDALEKNGLREETLVVYAGDQGYLLGEHLRFEKHTMWKESIRTPLVIRAGNRTTAAVRNQLTELVDFVPTALELLGLPPMAEVQGESLQAVLSSDTAQVRDLVFAEYLEDNMVMVADQRWKYIFSSGQRDLGLDYATGKGPLGIEHRLYNLQNDPEETTDVSGEAEFKPVLEKLQAAMLQKFMETHPEAALVPAELTVEGKLFWFAQPRDLGAEPDSAPLRAFYDEE
jgi:arylsulfatase A-like enzyme